MTNEVTVLRDDANAYCRILTLLGMEEEGDPVAEVASLLADIEANAGLRAKVAQQAALVEKCMAAMNENADRAEKAEARLAALEGQPHCATLHDDGYWTWEWHTATQIQLCRLENECVCRSRRSTLPGGIPHRECCT